MAIMKIRSVPCLDWSRSPSSRRYHRSTAESRDRLHPAACSRVRHAVPLACNSIHRSSIYTQLRYINYICFFFSFATSSPTPTVGARMLFSPLFVFPDDISKTAAARMFHVHEYRKLIWFGVIRQKVKVTKHKKQCRRACLNPREC